MNVVEIQFGGEDSNDIPLKLSESGKLSLSDITAATIGSLEPGDWEQTGSSNTDTTESVPVLRPWENGLREETGNQANAANTGNETGQCDSWHGTSRCDGDNDENSSLQNVSNIINVCQINSISSSTDACESTTVTDLNVSTTGILFFCPTASGSDSQHTSSTDQNTGNEQLGVIGIKDNQLERNTITMEPLQIRNNTYVSQNATNINCGVKEDNEKVDIPRNNIGDIMSSGTTNSQNKSTLYSSLISMMEAGSQPDQPIELQHNLYGITSNQNNQYMTSILSTLQQASTPTKHFSRNNAHDGQGNAASEYTGIPNMEIRTLSRNVEQSLPVPSLSNQTLLHKTTIDSRQSGVLQPVKFVDEKTFSVPILISETPNNHSSNYSQRGVLQPMPLHEKKKLSDQNLMSETPNNDVISYSQSCVTSPYMEKSRFLPILTNKPSFNYTSSYDQRNEFTESQKSKFGQRGTREIYEIAHQIDKQFNQQTPPPQNSVNQSILPSTLKPQESHETFIKRQKLETTFNKLTDYNLPSPKPLVMYDEPQSKQTQGHLTPSFMEFLDDISRRMAKTGDVKPLHENPSLYSTSQIQGLIPNTSIKSSTTKESPGQPFSFPALSGLMSDTIPACTPDLASGNGYPRAKTPSSTISTTLPLVMTNIMRSVENFNNSIAKMQPQSPIVTHYKDDSATFTPNAKRRNPNTFAPTYTPVQAKGYSHLVTTEYQSPAADSRYTDSLFSHLGSPHSNTVDHKYLGDLKALISSECKIEIVPQTLLKMHLEHPGQDSRENVFQRERSLQERFEAQRSNHQEEVNKLSSFFRYQSALIETDRFRTLHECQYPQSYKKSVNEHYDVQLHKVMDRVERSIELIESADKENRWNRISKARPHLSRGSVEMMERWYQQNQDHPYPTAAVIEQMAEVGRIGVEQVKKWFANKRNRSQNTRTLTEIAMKKRKLGQLVG